MAGSSRDRRRRRIYFSLVDRRFPGFSRFEPSQVEVYVGPRLGRRLGTILGGVWINYLIASRIPPGLDFRLGCFLGRLEVVLGASWGVLGASWRSLGASWARPGAS